MSSIMSLDQLSTSSPRDGLLITKRTPPPVPCLDESFLIDTKEFPIFGGESVQPIFYILHGPEEDESEIQQRIALSRGAVKMHYDDFTMEKKGIKVFLNNITVKNKHMLDNDVWVKESFEQYEKEKYYLAVMQYFQNKRNHLWKKKMVALEYEYRQDCLVNCRRPSLVELTEKINLFKARMIVCERFVCLHTYGLPGKNYKCWEDDEPFSFTCPLFWFNKWLEKKG